MTVAERASSPPPWERRLILFFALFAGLRIFVSAATLPLFATTDEQAHYDLVRKYARGYLPGFGTDHFDVDAALQIVFHETPEYVRRSDEAADDVPLPLWQTPPHLRTEAAGRIADYVGRPNHEAASPPVYYAVAAVWYHIGRLAGLQDGSLIYWIRFANAPLYAALVLGTYGFVRRFHSQDAVLRIAAPLLVAAFPQDVFFSINSDCLSPPLFLLAMHLLRTWSERDGSSGRLGVAAGLATAAVFLVKYSNVAILLLAATVLMQKLLRGPRRDGKRNGAAVACLASATALPILAWLMRNYVVLGDLSGTAAKVAYLNWTLKPLAELTDHPLFTFSGFSTFWSRLIGRFWCGEALWAEHPSTPSIIEWFFVLVTTVLLPAAAFAWLRSKRTEPPRERMFEGSYLMVVASSIAFLAFLSLLFDFGGCQNPSREQPYFTSGRLISGMLVPFVILLVHGTRWLAQRGPRGTTTFILASIVFLSLIAPLNLLISAAPSQFNWFHLK